MLGKIEAWRVEYNSVRPHSAIGHLHIRTSDTGMIRLNHILAELIL